MPLHNHSNGLTHGMGVCEEDVSGCDGELSLVDREAPARALAALNALRKSRQHYDVVVVAGGGEQPAHRAVLAAAAPHLARALGPPDQHVVRLPPVPADALAALLDYVYTGHLPVRDCRHALRLHAAAAQLRLDAPRDHLAATLVRRLAPHTCLEVRALPDLTPQHLATVDEYIQNNFDEICECGALASLPEIRIEMMRESSSEGGEESARVVAEAALAWLVAQPAADLEELCSRPHLVYVDAAGALRDCGDLPAASGDAPELQQYRKEAAARRRPAGPAPPQPARAPGDAVIAVRRGERGGARALFAIRGRVAAARLRWSDVAGGGVARGGALGGEAGGERRARMTAGRAALGCAALAGQLLVCGGYDRARVLRHCEAYEPARDQWTAAPDMRAPRARFPAARLGDTVFALGGSDGHAELDSVEAYRAGGQWETRARLPLALSHAAAAADEESGALYVVGGWAGGAHLRRVLRYSAREDAWSEAPPLVAGRAQCAAVVWAGELWALGGCDAWHCLATTERLALRGEAEGEWRAGPALPTARRSVGGAVWRGRLVSVGGSDGAASLRRVEWLDAGAEGWAAGPALRRPRAALGLAVLEETLYAVGGFDGKEFLSCVECLLAPDGEWTELRAPPAPHAPLPAPPAPHDPPAERPPAVL